MEVKRRVLFDFARSSCELLEETFISRINKYYYKWNNTIMTIYRVFFAVLLFDVCHAEQIANIENDWMYHQMFGFYFDIGIRRKKQRNKFVPTNFK